jgi:hypothetical protein
MTQPTLAHALSLGLWIHPHKGEYLVMQRHPGCRGAEFHGKRGNLSAAIRLCELAVAMQSAPKPTLTLLRDAPLSIVRSA